MNHLPTDSAERKRIPLAAGLFDYFPAAIAAVAAVSFDGNDKHNPGQPLRWARGKSNDHADTLLRHFAERGTVDTVVSATGRRHRHSAMMAWRALAILQLELEAAGEAPVAVTPRAAPVVRADALLLACETGNCHTVDLWPAERVRELVAVGALPSVFLKAHRALEDSE